MKIVAVLGSPRPQESPLQGSRYTSDREKFAREQLLARYWNRGWGTKSSRFQTSWLSSTQPLGGHAYKSSLLFAPGGWVKSNCGELIWQFEGKKHLCPDRFTRRRKLPHALRLTDVRPVFANPLEPIPHPSQRQIAPIAPRLRPHPARFPLRSTAL
jgi:hypothetical protein